MTKKRIGITTALIAIMMLSLLVVGCGSNKSASNTAKVEDSSLSAKQNTSLASIESNKETTPATTEETTADTSKNNATDKTVTANNDTTEAQAPEQTVTGNEASDVLGSQTVVRSDSLSDLGQQVMNLTNAQRADAGLNTLSYDGTLTAIANIRAQEIVEKWSHERPDGTNITALAKDFNYSYTVLGENLAKGQTSAEQAIAEWMASEGHKANILGNYTKIGVGTYTQDGKMYWVQIFSN